MPADRRTLGLLAAHFALVALLFVVRPHGALALAFGAVMVASAFVQLIAGHNTMHSPVFVSRRANSAWQAILSLGFTYPVSVFVPVHNLSHHLHLQTPRDVLRTNDVRHASNALNLVHHILLGTAHVHALNAAYVYSLRAKQPKFVRQACLEIAAVLAYASVLAWLDARVFFALVFLPSLLAQGALVGFGYVQHDGGDETCDYNNARNFHGRVFNWFIFNNAFHTIHHLRPGLHWSLGPKMHAELIAPHIAPSLEEPSIVAYMFRTFLLRGGRVRYDGMPVRFEATPPVARTFDPSFGRSG